jgi:hypothetical protein
VTHIQVGKNVRVVTDDFPHSAPRGTPPVPYWMVRVGDYTLGFYTDEIEPTEVK